jgi:DNA-binding NtrC family response regulator
MKKILLVEDDEIMRITVHDRLLQEKWQVDAVTNGRDALAKLEQNNYHLILSDIRMPGLGGPELLEWARSHAPMVDIFLMTAYGSVDDAVSCLRRGAAIPIVPSTPDFMGYEGIRFRKLWSTA